MTEPVIKPTRAPRIKVGITLPTTVLKKVEAYIASSVPEKHKLATERALLKQVPLSTAVRIKCLSCCNYEREDIINCAVVTCPLNQYRPYQPKL